VVAGPVIDELAQSYDAMGAPVLFLEQNVYDPQGIRIDRYHDARGGVACGVPWVIVDSGYGVTCGYQAFREHYRGLVDAALAHPAGAEIAAQYRRSNNNIAVEATVTNRSGRTIGFDDWATIHALVYEHAHVVHTDRFVRAATQTELVEDLADGASQTVSLVLASVPVQNWDEASVVVIFDYRPDQTQSRFEALQSAIAVEVTPTPTVTPTQPTATPSPTVATSTPSPTIELPTLPPNAPRIYLPFAAAG